MKTFKTVLIFIGLKIAELLGVVAVFALGSFITRNTVIRFGILLPIEDMGWLFTNMVYGVLGIAIPILAVVLSIGLCRIAKEIIYKNWETAKRLSEKRDK